jgi:hypothetical protein
MENESAPDFIGLARTSIEIFHPEVLDFPDDIIEKAVEFKAENLRESYKAMLADRNRGL